MPVAQLEITGATGQIDGNLKELSRIFIGIQTSDGAPAACCSGAGLVRPVGWLRSLDAEPSAAIRDWVLKVGGENGRWQSTGHRYN